MQFVRLSGSPEQLAAVGNRSGVWAPKAYLDADEGWQLAAYVEDDTLAALHDEGVPIYVIADSATLAARWAHIGGSSDPEDAADVGADDPYSVLFLPALVDISDRLDRFAADALVSDADFAYRVGVPQAPGRQQVVNAVDACIAAVQSAVELPGAGTIRAAVERVLAVVDGIDAAGRPQDAT